jgi:hypothetical protein
VLAVKFYLKYLGPQRVFDICKLMADPVFHRSDVPLESMIDKTKAELSIRKALRNLSRLSLGKHWDRPIRGLTTGVTA